MKTLTTLTSQEFNGLLFLMTKFLFKSYQHIVINKKGFVVWSRCENSRPTPLFMGVVILLALHLYERLITLLEISVLRSITVAYVMPSVALREAF